MLPATHRAPHSCLEQHVLLALEQALTLPFYQQNGQAWQPKKVNLGWNTPISSYQRISVAA